MTEVIVNDVSTGLSNFKTLPEIVYHMIVQLNTLPMFLQYGDLTLDKDGTIVPGQTLRIFDHLTFARSQQDAGNFDFIETYNNVDESYVVLNPMEYFKLWYGRLFQQLQKKDGKSNASRRKSEIVADEHFKADAEASHLNISKEDTVKFYKDILKDIRELKSSMALFETAEKQKQPSLKSDIVDYTTSTYRTTKTIDTLSVFDTIDLNKGTKFVSVVSNQFIKQKFDLFDPSLADQNLSFDVTPPNIIELHTNDGTVVLGVERHHIDITINPTLHTVGNEDVLQVFENKNDFTFLKDESTACKFTFSFKNTLKNPYSSAVLKDLIVTDPEFARFLTLNDNLQQAYETQVTIKAVYSFLPPTSAAVSSLSPSLVFSLKLDADNTFVVKLNKLEFHGVSANKQFRLFYLHQFETVIQHLMTMYDDRYESIKVYYQNFMPIGGSIVQTKRGKVFSAFYTRRCMKDRLPVQMSEDEAKKLLATMANNYENRPFLFPPEPPNSYWRCPGETYKYLGLLKKIKEPAACCFKRKETSILYDRLLKGEIKQSDIEQSTAYHYVIQTDKRVVRNQVGVVNDFFVNALFDDTVSRKGVDVSPHSFLDCVCDALNIDTWKREKFAQVDPNLFNAARQQMYNMTPSQIQTHLAQSNSYIDPRLYVPLFETVFNCKIYVVSKCERTLEKKGKWKNKLVWKQTPTRLLVPVHTQQMSTYRSNKQLVVIYEHMGSKDEENIYAELYPHCEIIVHKNNSGDVTRLDNLYQKLTQPFDQPLQNVVCQLIDDFGKLRLAQFKNGTAIATKPMAPLPVRTFQINQSSGVLPYFNVTSKIALLLENYVLWLASWHMSQNSTLKTVEQFKNIITISPSVVYNEALAKSALFPAVPASTPVTSFSYLKLIKNGTLLVPNATIKKRLIFVLFMNIKYRFAELLDYHKRTTLKNFYQHVQDFTKRPNQIISLPDTKTSFVLPTFHIFDYIDPLLDFFFFSSPYIEPPFQNVYLCNTVNIENIDELRGHTLFFYGGPKSITKIAGDLTKFLLVKVLSGEETKLKCYKMCLHQMRLKTFDDDSEPESERKSEPESEDESGVKPVQHQIPLRNRGNDCHALALFHALASMKLHTSPVMTQALAFVNGDAKYHSAYTKVLGLISSSNQEDIALDIDKLCEDGLIKSYMKTSYTVSPDLCQKRSDDQLFKLYLMINNQPTKLVSINSLIQTIGLKDTIHGGVDAKYTCIEQKHIHNLLADKYLVVGIERSARTANRNVVNTSPVQINPTLVVDINNKSVTLRPIAIVLYLGGVSASGNYSGHYVALVLDQNSWILYDDSKPPQVIAPNDDFSNLNRVKILQTASILRNSVLVVYERVD